MHSQFSVRLLQQSPMTSFNLKGPYAAFPFSRRIPQSEAQNTPSG
jgi:hypothetical protein